MQFACCERRNGRIAHRSRGYHPNQIRTDLYTFLICLLRMFFILMEFRVELKINRTYHGNGLIFAKLLELQLLHRGHKIFVIIVMTVSITRRGGCIDA